MSSRRPILFSSTVALGVGLASVLASGQTGNPAASSSAAPASASSASASVRVPPPPAPTRFTDFGLPSEASPRPKPADWKTATPFFEKRFPDCKARRLREWIELECRLFPLSSITLFTGPSKELAVTPGAGGVHDDVQIPAQVVFPLRRGDRYLLGMSSGFLESYESSAVSFRTVLLLSAYWLDEDPSPTLVFSEP
jgi:hypothetical protein